MGHSSIRFARMLVLIRPCFARSKFHGPSAIWRDIILPIGIASTQQREFLAKSGNSLTSSGAARMKRKVRDYCPACERCLSKLRRDFLLGLVTSGDGKRVRRQLRQFEFTALFGARICAEDAPRRKPHPAPLKCAMRSMNIRAHDCVYVGDAPEDVEMARRAGVRSIGIIGPFPSARRIRAARPDVLLESILDLPGVIVPFKTTERD